MHYALGGLWEGASIVRENRFAVGSIGSRKHGDGRFKEGKSELSEYTILSLACGILTGFCRPSDIDRWEWVKLDS